MFNENVIRVVIFVGLLLTISCLEALFPKRTVAANRSRRWPSNIGVSLFNQLAVKFVLPLSAAGLAVDMSVRGWGLLNIINLPVVVEIFIAILLLDLVIYWQHRIYHVIPLLWRLHRMHHADTVFDVTTGIRFHPLSILVSALIKLATVVVLGPSVVAVLLFEVLLNATSLFNHSNLSIPAGIDRILRLIVVTPDVHRVHHSIESDEMNCNFGFNFPWWDRFFGSYRQAPRAGHETMLIGLSNFRQDNEQRFDRMLTQPFRKN